MAIIKEITVNYGRTVGTGTRFEFLRVDVTMAATLQSHDKPDDVVRELEHDAKKHVMRMIAKKKQKRNIDDIY